MEQSNVIEIAQKPLRFYCVYLRDDENWGYVRVRANSYMATDYGTFAFFLESAEEVNRGFLKSNPPNAVYEIPRRNVDSIAEDGMIEVYLQPKVASKDKKKSKASGSRAHFSVLQKIGEKG